MLGASYEGAESGFAGAAGTKEEEVRGLGSSRGSIEEEVQQDREAKCDQGGDGDGERVA